MGIEVLVFILLSSAFLSLTNADILTILNKNRIYNRRKADRVNAITRSGTNAGKEAGFGEIITRYKLKLNTSLKYSAFDAGVDGLLRLKTLFSLMGLIIGILLKNFYLAAVLLAGMFWLPDAYFRILSLRYAKEADDAIETAMSLVSNSYLQNEDIKSSVYENISRIEQPLKEVFREFLAETGFIDASVINALNRMKIKTDNVYFSDWCDILIQCQDDRELKYVLPSMVSRLSGVKRIQAELDATMYDIYKEYIYVVGIVALNLPLMFLINSEWAEILFGTLIGKLTVAVCFTVIFAASAYVVSINRSLVRMTN